MTEVTDTKLNVAQRRSLSNRIHYVTEILDIDDPFITREVNHADARNAVRFLKEHGAIEKCGKRRVERGYDYNDGGTVDYVHEWEWREGAREWLRDYLEDMDTLPCGHRAHICNPREVDGFSCRHCIDDGEYPEYSRDLLESVGVV